VKVHGCIGTSLGREGSRYSLVEATTPLPEPRLPAYLYSGNGMRANFFGIVVLAGMLASSVVLSMTQG
jgi:hypothetical protein